MSELARTRLGFEHSDWLFGKLSFMKLSECILLDRMSVLPPKLAHIWVFLPSGAKKMQTLLQPSASGESAFFWLLQARIPRREPPSAAGLFHTLAIYNFFQLASLLRGSVGVCNRPEGKNNQM